MMTVRLKCDESMIAHISMKVSPAIDLIHLSTYRVNEVNTCISNYLPCKGCKGHKAAVLLFTLLLMC